IDPFDPQRPPVKHTAMGRVKHEGATVRLTADNRVAVYMGDDERFEYIYKFVSRDRWDPAKGREGGPRLLEDGTPRGARFNPDRDGHWVHDGGRCGFRLAGGGAAHRARRRRSGGGDADGPARMDRRAPEDRRGLLLAH